MKLSREYSLAIDTYERPDALRKLLESVEVGGWSFHSLVVIDDCSSNESTEELLSICEEFKCDFVRKRKRQFLGNSWNLGMIYCGTRYHIAAHGDIVFPKESKFLECLEYGFDLGRPIVTFFGLKSYGIDKAVIPEIMWHDERYPFLRVEDGDFILKGKEAFGPQWRFDGQEGFKGDTKLIVHQAHGRNNGNRAWLDDREESLHLDFFFKKWKVDEARILQRFPDAASTATGDNRANMAYRAYRTNFVTRQLAEVDFYPKITQRYLANDFSSCPEAVEPFAEIYKFRGE
jgi:glycosyltransferase involved in cell wall biosynthesis